MLQLQTAGGGSGLEGEREDERGDAAGCAAIDAEFENSAETVSETDAAGAPYSAPNPLRLFIAIRIAACTHSAMQACRESLDAARRVLQAENASETVLRRRRLCCACLSAVVATPHALQARCEGW
jgi:hypothetical protein